MTTQHTEETELPDDYSPSGDEMHHGAPTRKPQHFLPSAKRMLGLLLPEKARLTVIVLLVIGSVVGTVIAPIVLGQAVDIIWDGVRGAGHIDIALLGKKILLVLVLYVLSATLMWWQGYLLNGLVMRVVYKLRQNIEHKINRLPLKYFDTKQRGDILSRVTNDVDNVQQALQQGFSQLIENVLLLIGMSVMMLVVSWQLALITLISLPLSAVIAWVLGVRAQKLFVRQWKHTGEMNGHIEESFTGHEVVRIFNRGDAMSREFARRNTAVYEASYKAQFMSGAMMPAMMFVNYLIYVLIAVVGALRVTAGHMSLGHVTAFIQYAREFQQPVSHMAGVANMMQSGVASAERTFQLLDEEEERTETETMQLPERTDGHVTFDRVNFRYVEDQPLITDVSLEVNPGQTVAIVGPTGAGKTTLVNLLMRFYELQSGSITIDGIDIAELTRPQLRSRVGMVLQDAWLFEGTIRENIRYGRLDATDDEVIAAAEATMVDRFVRQLPEGYDTVITENASSLSSGERQLLTIARAFLAQPSLLILDEATSSVDTRTEMLVQEAMHTLRKDRTSFVIAHRLSTIRDADLILMMDNGNIIEQGTHEQLLTLNGAYAHLYAAQFEGGNEEQKDQLH